MFTDELRNKVWDEIRQRDLRAFGRLLPAEVFVAAAQLAGVRLGRSALSLVQLVWLGTASAMHRTRSFASILRLSVQLLDDSGLWHPKALSPAKRKGRKAGGKPSKHSPRARQLTQVTEEAFVQARARMPLSFWTALLLVLGQRFEREHAAWVRWKEFRLLALDGTTINLPAWRSLKTHFGTAKNGKSKGRTQARLVMLQLPLVRMPWRYAVSPIRQGERTLAADLLEHLSPDDLVLMDRGFWSYGLFHQVQGRGAHFAIRLPAGIRLRTLRVLGPRDRLVRWNMPTGPRWRESGLPPHIDLRAKIRGQNYFLSRK